MPSKTQRILDFLCPCIILACIGNFCDKFGKDPMKNGNIVSKHMNKKIDSQTFALIIQIH